VTQIVTITHCLSRLIVSAVPCFEAPLIITTVTIFLLFSAPLTAQRTPLLQQYKCARMISTLDVHWQPAKCRVKVANAARCSSRTRAKLVTSDHSKCIYFSRATSIYPFVHNFPTGISRYRLSCDMEIELFFLLVFHCLVHKPRMTG
jgi:hypothetical protein